MGITATAPMIRTPRPCDKIDEKANSFFANISYPVTDKWRLLGGIRYSTENMYARNLEFHGNEKLNREEKEVDYSKPDYKAGFEYDLGSESMIYGNYSTSYRVMAWRGKADVYQTEELKAYTIGSKNRFFGNKLQVNGSAYYQTGYPMSWRDKDYPYNWQEFYHISDASLAYTNPDNKWTLSLWMKNIEDYAVKRIALRVRVIFFPSELLEHMALP